MRPTNKSIVIAVLFVSLISYSAFAENVVPVTECGGFGEDGTTYVLQNDIYGGGPQCVFLSGSGTALDLNGFNISSDSRAIFVSCNGCKIMNGNVISGGPLIEIENTAKISVENVSMYGTGSGVLAHNMFYGFFKNTFIHAYNGIVFFQGPVNNIFMQNVVLAGPLDGGESGITIDSQTSFNIVSEKTRIENYANSLTLNVDGYTKWYSRDDEIDFTKIEGSINDELRIFEQHLTRLDVKNQTGNGIRASVEISDNGAGSSDIYSPYMNPTVQSLGTNNNGEAQAFVTRRITVIKGSTDAFSFNEISFNPYTFTAGAGSVTDTKTVSVDSPTALDFTLNMPTTTTVTNTLPICTINRMLDLNNDGRVNLRDASIIIAKFAGRNVKTSGTKECNALSFFPFNGIS